MHRPFWDQSQLRLFLGATEACHFLALKSDLSIVVPRKHTLIPL